VGGQENGSWRVRSLAAMLTVLTLIAVPGCGSSAVTPSAVVSESSPPPISHLLKLLDANKDLIYEATYSVETTQFDQASTQVVTVMQKPPKLVYSSDGRTVYTSSASSDAQLDASRSSTVTCNTSSSDATSCQTVPPNSVGILSGAEGFLARQQTRGELENIAEGLKSRNPDGLIDSVRTSTKTVADQESQCVIAIGTPASTSATFCLNDLGVLTFAKWMAGTATLTSFSTSVSESDLLPPPAAAGS
jgi:hypothetical protein